MISQTYDLNLIPSQIPVTIHCSQYDDGSRTFVFNLYEGASAFEIPTRASVTFSGVKPDGLGFQYGCSITGASQVSVDVELQMTAVAGDCPCKVTVYDTDSNVLGSALCVLDVERHPLQDDTVISDSDIPLVQEAVNWAAQFQPTDFVQKNQGVAQAGKVLGIGADGMVTPTDATVDAENVSYNGIVLPQSDNVEEAIDNVYIRSITSYRTTASMETTIDDADYIPFRDNSEGADKNITLPNFVDTISPNFYRVTDSAETTIDDSDSVPFYDTSASAKKRITWSNIVTKIKSSLANYFGRKFSQSNGKLSLLSENNTSLDTVTLSPLATNTSYTDTNKIGATNVQSAIDKLTLLSNKFYYEHYDNYTTNGTWASYTDRYVTFDIPQGAYGAGKTFMVIHNVAVRRTANTSFESKIELSGMAGTVYLDTYGHVGSNGLWPTFNHIAFVKCNVKPTFIFRLCSDGAVSNIYSTFILVPLN